MLYNEVNGAIGLFIAPFLGVTADKLGIQVLAGGTAVALGPWLLWELRTCLWRPVLDARLAHLFTHGFRDVLVLKKSSPNLREIACFADSALRVACPPVPNRAQA